MKKLLHFILILVAVAFVFILGAAYGRDTANKSDPSSFAVREMSEPSDAPETIIAESATSPSSAVSKSSASKSSSSKSTTVYVTKTGSKYHKSSCQYLSQSKISISKSEAKEKGYTACSKCKP